MSNDFLYAPYRVENESAETIRKRNKSGNIVPVKGGTNTVFGWDANGIAGPVSLDSSWLTDRSRNVWLGATAWVLEQGTPVLAVHGSAGALFQAPVWELDGTAREGVATVFLMPTDWNLGTISFNIYWAPSDANTGNVFWDVVGAPIVDGSQIDDATVWTVQATSAAPGVAEQLTVLTTAAVTVTNTTGLIRLNLVRYADLASDTYNAHDAWFVGLRVNYTAVM